MREQDTSPGSSDYRTQKRILCSNTHRLALIHLSGTITSRVDLAMLKHHVQEYRSNVRTSQRVVDESRRYESRHNSSIAYRTLDLTGFKAKVNNWCLYVHLTNAAFKNMQGNQIFQLPTWKKNKEDAKSYVLAGKLKQRTGRTLAKLLLAFLQVITEQKG